MSDMSMYGEYKKYLKNGSFGPVILTGSELVDESLRSRALLY